MCFGCGFLHAVLYRSEFSEEDTYAYCSYPDHAGSIQKDPIIEHDKSAVTRFWTLVQQMTTMLITDFAG